MTPNRSTYRQSAPMSRSRWGREGSGVEVASGRACKAMKASPRLVLGWSATIAAIAAVSPVAVAGVSNLGRRAGEGRGEEEMKLHLGEKGRAWTTIGLAWPGGQRRRPAMVRP